MRAVVIPMFGGSDVLRVQKMPAPRPGPHEIAIDVVYAGVNFAEILYRRGLIDVPLPFIPGIEVAGTVREIGTGVSGFVVGQPVAALTIINSGGYAQIVTTAAEVVIPLDQLAYPIDLAIAAAAPSNVTTAFLVLDTIARLAPGDRVLIHAAAGGVGSVLGQVARMLGASAVIGTVGSTDKIPLAKRWGCKQPQAERRRLCSGAGGNLSPSEQYGRFTAALPRTRMFSAAILSACPAKPHDKHTNED